MGGVRLGEELGDRVLLVFGVQVTDRTSFSDQLGVLLFSPSLDTAALSLTCPT